MILAPGPIAVDGLDFVIEDALGGALVSGPWDTETAAALRALAESPSAARESAARQALAGWVQRYNENLPS